MDFLNKYQQLIAENIEKYQFNGEPFELYEPMNYIIANGGKRLRPVLTLMAAELFGGDMDKALKPALAIEFFHNFTLIHDDIMDEAPLRRNKPTVHTLHGINIGILSGDALLIKSYQFFEDLEDSQFKKCIQLFSETGIKICEGQQMDVNFETNNKVSYDDYIQMITYKTAVLCASALKIGAIIAHAEESDAHAIYEFGRHLGIAFQMMDDYLDVFGSQEQFGKRQAGDIYENKKTILYLLALKNADEVARWSAYQITKKILKFKPTREKPFVLGLPTGSTPLATYRELINLYNEGILSFENVVTFNMDEYVGLKPEDPQSYHYFIK